ncbi:MAG: HEAT repeat domain-containing protein [Nitrospirae bacterium]|nr:HEAT repeat domain-containing protein [Nitrospirota bacterium]
MAQPRPTTAPGKRPEPPSGVGDQDLATIKHLLILLDKTFKTVRIYGANNPVARKFVQQFYQEISSHLAIQPSIAFLVQRFDLYYQGELVYQNTSLTENLAFKLHADGIRELRFNQGLTQEDLSYFLETLQGDYDTENEEEDIVTRLWDRNLPSISLVTAEEIVKSPKSVEVMTPQDSTTLNSPVTRLKEVRAAETARQAQEAAEGKAKGKSRFQSGLPGYEVSQAELDQLARDLQAESSTDSISYVMNVLAAILTSEKAEDTVGKVLEMFDEILIVLIAQGDWKQLNTALKVLRDVADRPELAESLRNKLTALFAGLGNPEQLKTVEKVLNGSAEHPTEGLMAFLLQLKSSAVSSLCTLLSNLDHREHRSVVCEALVEVAKDAPEPLINGLSDSRGHYVRNLVFVLGRLGDQRLAERVASLARHQDRLVRREAVRAIGALRQTGHGGPLAAFLNDSEGSIRMGALKLLTNGHYTVPFSAWSSIITQKEFTDRFISEKRATFLAISQTAGDQAVTYWRTLVTQWLWTNRAKKQELGVLAAEALGRTGTPAAVAALKAGEKRRNKAIRNACTVALASLAKRQQAAAAASSKP